MRPPKFCALYRRLFGEGGGYWAGHLQGGALDIQPGLRMEALSGCPDEAMLGIAEVSALAHWKATEKRNGSLSYRDLIRRGDAVEQRLRKHRSDLPQFADMDQVPLHPNLLQASSMAEAGQGTLAFPNDAMRLLVANIFRETVVLYLHTVLNDSNPGT
jgi:C6 transcription factor Pro1